jgi:tryptophan 2,3-dioxygenase
MKHPPVQYHDYLKLDLLLNAQALRSEELGTKAHDELLFITVHQTYELWFKQMLAELDSVMKIFGGKEIDESMMGLCVSRLERVAQIQKYINGQIDILESMTALDFLDFRDYLYPASGFQSFQWRCLETKLGLSSDQRLTYNQQPFYTALKTDQQAEMKKVMEAPTLFELVEKWLERIPFLQTEDFDFWLQYQKAVETLFAEDRKVIEGNPRLETASTERLLKQMDSSMDMFHALFEPKRFAELQGQGYFRMSAKALQSALMIQLYCEQPILQMPFRVIRSLLDLDEQLTQWRQRHAQMAHRMLGKKIGTGGSSGHDYLRSAAEKHKVFGDFFNLTTFFIPRSMVPALPIKLKRKMDFA